MDNSLVSFTSLGRGCPSAFLPVFIRGPQVCGSELREIKSTVPHVTLLPSNPEGE